MRLSWPMLRAAVFGGALALAFGASLSPMSSVRSVTHVSGPTAPSRRPAGFGGQSSLPAHRKLERAKGFEPSTPTLARSCSTPELHPHPRTGEWVAAGRATYAKSGSRLQQRLKASQARDEGYRRRGRNLRRTRVERFVCATILASTRRKTNSIRDDWSYLRAEL